MADVDKGSFSVLTLMFAVLVHVLLLVPILSLTVISVTNFYHFQWHVIGMTLGVAFICEASFLISSDVNLNSRCSRSWRVTLHWVLQTIGILFLILGLYMAIEHRVEHGKGLFTSLHGMLGLVALVFTAIVAFFGIFAKNTRWLYPTVNPIFTKIFHAFFGICSVILLLATTINGTYKKWWYKNALGMDPKNATREMLLYDKEVYTSRNAIFLALFVAGFLLLLKPLVQAHTRWQNVLKRRHNEENNK